MNANERECLNAILTGVVGGVYEVANVLGGGFLEKVYERALVMELRARGYDVEAQAPVRVSYKGAVIGDYYADLLVDGKLIVELKCVDKLRDEHITQCLNYLCAGGLKLGCVFNMRNSRIEYRRVVNDF